jgi:hypothetical protein
MNIARQFKVYEKLLLDVRGEFFNIFNHGEAGISNSTLISGINTDAYSNNGTNVFDNPAPNISGHRHIRIVVKFSF